METYASKPTHKLWWPLHKFMENFETRLEGLLADYIEDLPASALARCCGHAMRLGARIHHQTRIQRSPPTKPTVNFCQQNWIRSSRRWTRTFRHLNLIEAEADWIYSLKSNLPFVIMVIFCQCDVIYSLLALVRLNTPPVIVTTKPTIWIVVMDSCE